MSDNALIAALIGALIACLVCLVPTLIRLNSLERRLRLRVGEGEKRAALRQKELVDSVNTVLQMSASVSQSAEERARQVSDRVEARLDAMTRANERQMADMRDLVDRQLGATLDRRLGQSFQQVTRQLEMVHQGLGEMQALAGGVGDLKKVLQGVKTRGIWGEMQLGDILRDILTPAQYAENTPVVPGSAERVEFAVKLPGRDGEGLLLPIDSKFPLDAFTHLVEATENGDKAAVAQAKNLLRRALTEQAAKISEKYIHPPYTTDFAVMFLPLESLYAQALQDGDVMRAVREKHRIVIAGPSTMGALLNSLSLGFRTLSIEQRTGEVWATLGALRGEFARFGETLERMRQRLDQATGELDTATARSRAITRRLDELEKFEQD